VPPNLLPRVGIGNATIVEGNAGARVLKFAVTLSSAAATAVTMHFATEPRTATAADFTATSGTVKLAAQATSAVVNVTVTPDTSAEATEGFKVRLSAVVGATFQRAVGNGSILNDD
jgi:Calx-beta domain